MARSITRKRVFAKSNHSSGGGGGSTNIYNSDGSLTGSRTLFGNGHDLLFEGLSSFYIGQGLPANYIELNSNNGFFISGTEITLATIGTNGLNFVLDDITNIAKITTSLYPDGLFGVDNGGTVTIGDYYGDSNNTSVRIVDSTQIIELRSAAGNIFTLDGINELSTLVTQSFVVSTSISYPNGLLSVADSGIVSIGDFNGDHNNTNLSIDDTNRTVTINCDNFEIFSNVYSDGLIYADNTGVVLIGDGGGDIHGTQIKIDDGILTVTINAGALINCITASYQISGMLSIIDGTQGAGKVFTSDSGGTGSWQSISAASGWGTPTGTLNRAAINDSSTQATINHTLQALITDLKTKGYITA